MSGTSLYVGTRGSVVYVFSKAGKSWFPMKEGLGGLKVKLLSISNMNLPAAPKKATSVIPTIYRIKVDHEHKFAPPCGAIETNLSHILTRLENT